MPLMISIYRPLQHSSEIPGGTRDLRKLLVKCPGGGGGGGLRFGSDGGVPLKPPNPYLSLRVILAEKGTHY